MQSIIQVRSSLSHNDKTKLPGVDSKGQFMKKYEQQQAAQHDRHYFYYKRLLNQLRPDQILASAIAFWKQVPTFIWTFFIEAFLVPAYRPEWSVYSTWQVITEHDSDAEAETGRRKAAKKRRKITKTINLTTPIPKAVKHNHALCHLITINVSGKIYQTQRRSLAHYPDTLLGDPKRLAQFYDPVHDDYFIDRNSTCFDAILYYYQSKGILRRPNNVSLEMFEEEIQFFDLGLNVIDNLRREEGILIDIEKSVPRRLLQRKYWLLFEYPESSMQARIVAIFSILAVIISIFIFCLETLDSFDLSEDEFHELTGDDIVSLVDPFYVTETACIGWFIFELVMRVITCPRKIVFFKSATNIIDILAILPYFISVLIQEERNRNSSSNRNLNKATSFTIFRVVRLVRVFRILKLSRHNRGLKVLGKTLRASIRELALLVFFLIIGIVLFSSAVYFAELQHPDSHFSSIIDAFWWSVITMTTCGYGDAVPQTVMGKIVGALCAISGVLTLALPVPVIVSNFNNFYNREEDTSSHVELDHIPQCPWRSGWYGLDGSVKSDHGSQTATWNVKMVSWVHGENKPDDSDSEFEPLRQIEYDSNVEFRDRLTKMRSILSEEDIQKQDYYKEHFRKSTQARASMFTVAQ